jgi:hypothetical protein
MVAMGGRKCKLAYLDDFKGGFQLGDVACDNDDVGTFGCKSLGSTQAQAFGCTSKKDGLLVAY